MTANVFLQNDFKVYLFEDYAPTPFIPLGVKKYGCLAGIMVTASHNPKDDNGFKLYWGNGAQVIILFLDYNYIFSNLLIIQFLN